MKTLVVDDFATMRKIVKNVLRQIDITNVAEADNGKRALEVLRKEGDFELIVSDWIMPEMTGLEFLKACKEDEYLKKIPFVMVTAEAQKDKRDRGDQGRRGQLYSQAFHPGQTPGGHSEGDSQDEEPAIASGSWTDSSTHIPVCRTSSITKL